MKDEYRPWFRNRAYGYGWYPTCVEGWLVLIVWFLVVLGSTMVLLVAQINADAFWRIVLLVMWGLVQAANTVSLLIILQRKGEKPHWLTRRKK